MTAIDWNEPHLRAGGDVGQSARTNRTTYLVGLFAPSSAILMLLLLLGLLLWLVNRSERERQREDLIRDTLWVEQTIEFRRDTDFENLNRLAIESSDSGAGQVNFAKQALQLVSNNPEIQEIILRNFDGQTIAAVPPFSFPENQNHTLDLAIAETSSNGSVLGRGALSNPVILHEGGTVLIYLVPIFTQGKKTGSLAAIFSLSTILSHQIPWWIAEKSAVQIKDNKGTILASRSRIEISSDSTINTVPLSSFGGELSLVLSSYNQQTNLMTNGLVGTMILLGLVAIGGLYARENHIRQRRKAETALRAEYAFRKAMENSLTVGVRAHDLDRRIIYVNNAFCQMTGYDTHELLGHLPPMPYWLPDEIDRAIAFQDATLTAGTPQKSIELTFRQKNGKLLHALVFETPLIDEEGVHRGWMGSFIDITDRKAMEATAGAHLEKLAQTARLIMIGEVASLIAHDLNQPLAAITSYSTGLSNRIKSGKITPKTTLTAIDKIGELAKHAGGIVQKVQDFVRKSAPRFEPTDIGDAIREAIEFYDRETRPHASRIVLTKLPEVVLANVDRILIEQVIINLLRNAEEAMQPLPAGKRRIDVNLIKLGEEIQIQVSDRGPSLSAELKSEIFKPFFTTKSTGMGIGLTICRSILEAHYGRLTFATRDKGGAVFTCVLPAVKPDERGFL